MLRHTHGLYGIYRWFLATTVVINHLGPESIKHLGYYSVFAFFVLSAYLASINLNHKYMQMQNGVKYYLIKRFLRIYPLYLIILLFAYVTVSIDSGLAKHVYAVFAMPNGIYELLTNIFIIGNTGFFGLSITNFLIPTSWSTAVEIYFWVLMPMIINRSKAILVCTFISMFCTVILLEIKAEFYYRYFALLGCSLPFCLGYWLYKLQPYLPNISNRLGAFFILVCLLCYVFSCKLQDPYFYAFYAALFSNILVISYLSTIELGSLPKLLIQLDNVAGNIAYAVFLSHILLAYIFKLYIPVFPEVRSFPYLFINILAVNILAIGLYYYVEKPIYDYFNNKYLI